MAKSFLQGTYVPQNPKKYVGDATRITFRSSWEREVMIFFDTSPNILKWASEEIAIPYLSPLDERVHRYFPDFQILVKDKDGNNKRYVVEVKPLKECFPPISKKQTKRLITETSTFLVNRSKWNAASKWCQKNNFEFVVISKDKNKFVMLTEKELFDGPRDI